MGRFVNPSNAAFQVALNSEIYVDKTEMLAYTNKVLGSMHAFICNSRPRRFGKSIAANMLAAYYSKGCDSREMFSHFKISQTEAFQKYLNRYDVIQLDVQWCLTTAKSAKNVVSYMEHAVIQELQEEYPSIIKDSEVALSDCLSKIHDKTGNQFVIIMDEWDVLMREEAANQEIQEQYIDFLRSLFKGTEPTKYIALAYLTGILPIIRVKTQSALNNFDEFTMLSSLVFSEYIGFTEIEVRELCKKYDKDFEEVKRWYDGYLLGKENIYNPKAVTSVMEWGEYKSYWSETGTYEAIQPYINMDFDGLKTAIIEMLAGSSVPVKVAAFKNDMVRFSGKDDILTLLIHLGYLAYDQKKRRAFIPNEEIRQEFEYALQEKRWSEMLEFQQKSEKLLHAVLEKNTILVAEQIEKIHNRYASTIQYNDENSLSSVLTIAFLSSMEYYFMPVREYPTGKGFADFVYIPKPEYADQYPLLVVELKWDKSAETALDQIKDRRYTDSLKQYSGELLLVGINYDKKREMHECTIERFEKA